MPDLSLPGDSTLLADWTDGKHLALILNGAELPAHLFHASRLNINAADLDDEGRKVLGTGQKLLIVRPDGYVGFRGPLNGGSDWITYAEQDGLAEALRGPWHSACFCIFAMPIQLKEENDGKFLAIHVIGRLVRADYDTFVPECERLIRQHGKLRVLFDMTGLQGWDAGAAWEDIKFDLKHFADIERLATVGQSKLQHGMAAFFKPFTKSTTRNFDHDLIPAARKWLSEP